MTLRHCHNCTAGYKGKPLALDRLSEKCQRLEAAHLCPACRKAHFERVEAEFAPKRQELAADQQAKRLAAWAKFVGENRLEEIADSDEARLRERPEFGQVEAWRFGRRGLILGGETGLSKTRIAFWLLRREFLAGRSVGYVNCAALHTRLMAASRRHFGADGELLEAWERAEVLLVDDLGKGGIGDQHEAKFFGLIDARTEAGRPIIATQNARGADLEAAMSPDRGGPFMRRLRMFNDPIKFL